MFGWMASLTRCWGWALPLNPSHYPWSCELVQWCICLLYTSGCFQKRVPKMRGGGRVRSRWNLDVNQVRDQIWGCCCKAGPCPRRKNQLQVLLLALRKSVRGKIWNPAFRIWNPAPGIWNLASGILNNASGIWNPASGIVNNASGIWNPDYGTWNPASRIVNPASRILNPAPGCLYVLGR